MLVYANQASLLEWSLSPRVRTKVKIALFFHQCKCLLVLVSINWNLAAADRRNNLLLGHFCNTLKWKSGLGHTEWFLYHTKYLTARKNTKIKIVSYSGVSNSVLFTMLKLCFYFNNITWHYVSWKVHSFTCRRIADL